MNRDLDSGRVYLPREDRQRFGYTGEELRQRITNEAFLELMRFEVDRARAIIGDPQIILADEPTGSLDEESAGIILDLLRGVHIRGATVIIATHDKALMRKTGGQVLHIQQGRLETSVFLDKHYDNAIF